MSSSYRLELDRWLASLDVSADSVLDLGGSQLNVKGRTKSWDVKDYLIADLPEPHIGSPKPDIELDLNINMLKNFDAYKKQFDLVFCLEVFDYVWNPSFAVINICQLLKDGGTAWISFPTVYPHHQPIEDDALRYMQGGIKKLLVDWAGFEILQMIPRRPETNAIENLWRAERMRAAKHFDHNVTGYIVEVKKV